jgi:hypothetical protein
LQIPRHQGRAAAPLLDQGNELQLAGRVEVVAAMDIKDKQLIPAAPAVICPKAHQRVEYVALESTPRANAVNDLKAPGIARAIARVKLET